MTGRRDTAPRTVLEHLIRQRDQTYDELAEAFETLARQTGERGASMSARHLRRLASGQRTGMTPVTRRVLQAMFGRPAAELVAPYATTGPTLATGPFAGPAGATGTATRSGQDAAVARDADDLDVLERAARRARGFGLLVARTTLGEESLEQVYAEVRQLTHAYQQRPLPRILGTLAATQDLLFTLLEGPQRPTHVRRLYFAAALVSGMLAKLAHDRVDAPNAMAHAHAAFVCADLADHNGLRAWARGLQSVVSYWIGRPQDAIRYAQAGADYATTDGTEVWLHASEARALAVLTRARPGAPSTGRQGFYYAADAMAWLPTDLREDVEVLHRDASAWEDAARGYPRRGGENP
ncbi:XRE family transcriptional regulator [Actinopolymorpha sp. NPDC004070]|uniref:XRE family transcriptional regulator n=1 Tax=Actinopolymorpha sp. NPDC004070 TaxID=3154548 RepID=UPI0033B05380